MKSITCSYSDNRVATAIIKLSTKLQQTNKSVNGSRKSINSSKNTTTATRKLSSTGASAPDKKSGEISAMIFFTTPPFISGGDGAQPAPTRSGGGPFSSSHGAAEQEDA